MPAGYRGKQAVPALVGHIAGLPHAGKLRRRIRAGLRSAETGVPVLVRGGGNRRVEQAQRTAQDEGSRGGRPVRVLPQARPRRPPREVDAGGGHTQQDCDLRKDTGEQADHTDTGALAGEVRVPHQKGQAGKHGV